MPYRILLAALLSLAFHTQFVFGNEYDFTQDVYLVFQRSCFECHGPERQEADLRLDTADAVKRSGLLSESDPGRSELIRRIRLPRGHDEVMPAIGDPLLPTEVQRLEAWVAHGGKWPPDFAAPPHWSYLPPTAPPLPPRAELSNPDWPKQPLDHFVARRLQAAKLQPSPPASPAALVRRVFLDVIGLPPTPAEVKAFVANPSDEAYAALVDDLLSRPQFGERWARPWLDLARYADSHGFQRDNFRDVWPYRDWVIRSLNQDMPFDQFTIEQLAGDLLPQPTEQQRIATGFHRCTPTNVEAGSLPEETRTEQVIDRVNTTAAVWLGTTLECAQCHDHKYDPFTSKEYYQLLAFFDSTELEADRANPKQASSIKFLGPYMPISHAPTDRKREAIEADIKSLEDKLAERSRQLAKDLADWAAAAAEREQDAPREHPLKVTLFKAESGDPHEILDDQSVLLPGLATGVDVYKVELTLPPALQLSALKIEALRHDRLPGKGPGRGDPQRRNFILSEFSASSGGQPLKFVSAVADFSQERWNVSKTIDGDERTGWAVSPQFDRGHWARFELESKLDTTKSSSLKLRISQQYGTGRTIGRIRFSAVTGDLRKGALPATVAKAIRVAAKEWSPQDRKAILDYRLGLDADARRWQADLNKRRKELKDVAPAQTLVMNELQEPRETRVYVRGDYRNPGERVQPGAPAALHVMPKGPANRLTLARWLVSRDNPLTARVTVNRWWAELFGEGIVRTLEDFGVKGERPTHPALLDHLAVSFMDHGWSMKRTLRTILLSATYRQSSRVTSMLREMDPANRLLARGPRFRLDAEMIRDNALAISGLLSLKPFGPPIRPYQPPGIWSKVGGTNYSYKTSPGNERHRRGIYVVLKRGAPYPSFINFDGSARLACTVQRSRTNTPLQALTLLNDPVYVEAAKALALRMVDEANSNDIDARIAYGFRLCTARLPQEGELHVLRRLYDEQLAALRDDDARAAALVDDVSLPADVPTQEFAAWYGVATTLLNLHETITKH